MLLRRLVLVVPIIRSNWMSDNTQSYAAPAIEYQGIKSSWWGIFMDPSFWILVHLWSPGARPAVARFPCRQVLLLCPLMGQSLTLTAHYTLWSPITQLSWNWGTKVWHIWSVKLHTAQSRQKFCSLIILCCNDWEVLSLDITSLPSPWCSIICRDPACD